MINKITILIALILFTTSNYAQVHKHKKGRETKKYELTTKFNKIKKYSGQDLLLTNTFFSKQEVQLKSSKANKLSLDSIIEQDWDIGSSIWYDNYKEEFTYGTEENIIQYFGYDWDNNTNQWLVSFKVEYSWDNGNLTQSIYYSNGALESKEEYTYDTNGNFTQIISYEWDEATSQWIKVMKLEFTYGSNGKLEYIEYLYCESGSCIVVYKDVFTYDGNGKLIIEIEYELNQTTFQLVENYKWEYTYDTYGNIILETEYSWNETTNQWNENYKWEISFGQNAKMLIETQYAWNEATSQWVAEYRWEYDYDSNRNVTSEIEYIWNTSSNQWIESYKYNYTYDISYSISDLIIPFIFNDYSVFFENMLTEFIGSTRNNNSNEWVNSEKSTLYYSEQTNLSVSDIRKEDLLVYPNPFSKDVRISIPGSDNQITFKLFDVQGRKLISRVINNNENVNLESLEGGMYFYNLTVEGKRLNGKLIKK